MIRIFQLNRRVVLSTDTVDSETCTAHVAVGYDSTKFRFHLTPDEAQKLNELTEEIEERIARDIPTAAFIPAAEEQAEKAASAAT
jgi:hypothetical protein